METVQPPVLVPEVLPRVVPPSGAGWSPRRGDEVVQPVDLRQQRKLVGLEHVGVSARGPRRSCIPRSTFRR